MQIRKMRNAKAVQPGIETGHAHLPFDDPKPAPSDQDAVSANDQPGQIAPRVSPHRRGRRGTPEQRNDGPKERGDCRRNEGPERGAPMDEIWNVEKANDEV